MITRGLRFHGYGSLNYVYKHGQSVRGPIIALRYGQNERRSQSRIAVVVSKKVHKSAVVRNRIRRRIYEIMRQLQPSVEGSHDLIISVFSDEVATMPHADLDKLLKSQLQKARIIA
jgi:ribonuclease P protein component